MIFELCSGDFLLYFGDDVIVMEFMLLGVKGNILVIVNVVFKVMFDFCVVVMVGNCFEVEIIN